VGALIAILLIDGIASATNTEKEQAAVAVAKKWLTLVDSGKYSESWRDASLFKSKFKGAAGISF